MAAVVLTPWPATPEPIHDSNRDTIRAAASVRVDVLPEIDLATPARWPALRV